jgi:hypothetical protein
VTERLLTAVKSAIFHHRAGGFLAGILEHVVFMTRAAVMRDKPNRRKILFLQWF